MDNQMMNPMQQAPNMQSESPKKKGHGALITILVIIVLAIIALAVFGKKNDVNAPTDTSPAAGASQDDQDLSSIEADLQATSVDGVSDGL